MIAVQILEKFGKIKNLSAAKNQIEIFVLDKIYHICKSYICFNNSSERKTKPQNTRAFSIVSQKQGIRPSVANNRQTERKTTIFLPANLTKPVCLSSIISKRVRIATTNCFGSPSRAPFDISNEVFCDSHGGDEKPLCR